MRAFDDVRPMDRQAAAAALASDDTTHICHALIAVALYEADWRWVQEQCLTLLASTEAEISGLAATCLGHLARIHGQLDRARVIRALQERRSDPHISGRIGDALDDIAMFVPGD
jgi:hypothetical protein